jgi:hypothetical protein
MSPKEKAQQLFNKFYKVPLYIKTVKQCCHIVVNEIIEGYEFDSLDIEHKRIMDNINFWDEVKEEIDKL